jgi:hypothetical protein
VNLPLLLGFTHENYPKLKLFHQSAIDIIIGGPPSHAYIPRFGELINSIQQYQKGHHVFFLAENTSRKGDLEDFGVTWSINLDCKYFSPVRRTHCFLSNIPVTTINTDYYDEQCTTSYLKDNYCHGANIFEPDLAVKYDFCTESNSRIDDTRLIVFKKDDGNSKRFLQRLINTNELETMMGYPTGYVEEPGKWWMLCFVKANVCSH